MRNKEEGTDAFVTKADPVETVYIVGQITILHLINQHLIEVHHQAPDFLLLSFCPSPVPSCIFVNIPSTGLGNNKTVADGKSVLLAKDRVESILTSFLKL